MITFPNCKINLGLNIVRKRADGYHDLETVFYPVRGLTDALEVVPANGATTLTTSGKAVAGNNESNLVWKAYALLAEKYPDRVRPLDMYLHKVIPMGAGLGGGSADGAFALQLIADCFELAPGPEALREMALKLGSDCPFFLLNEPCFASGRGEAMTPLALDLSAYSLQVLCPGIHVSTATAFGMITPKAPAYDLRNLGNLPINDWKEQVGNDFENPVFTQHPELKALKDKLYSDGALYASLTGTGSAVYGFFEKGKKAEVDAAEQFYFA